MNIDKQKIVDHIRDFGICTLARAVYEASSGELFRPYAYAMSVIKASHGAELIIKARISQEHPLLIFDTLPKSTHTQDALTISELFDYGKTIQYSDLIEKLWATTGYRLDENKRSKFVEFGKLRNMIMHFAIPDIDLSEEVLRFTFEIIDPLLEDFWNESIVPYIEDLDDILLIDGYLKETLENLSIKNLTATSKKIFAEYNEKSS